MNAHYPIVRFKTPAAQAPASDEPFQEEVARFAAVNERWRNILEMGAARLSPGARRTLGVALSGLEAGPPPRLMSFDFGPDDADGIAREADHMEPKLLTALGLLTSPKLGLRPDETLAVQGLLTAVHRLLRVAKTRP